MTLDGNSLVYNLENKLRIKNLINTIKPEAEKVIREANSDENRIL